jgi:hypothetical protein
MYVPPGFRRPKAGNLTTQRGVDKGALSGVPVQMVCEEDVSMDNNRTSIVSHNNNNN